MAILHFGTFKLENIWWKVSVCEATKGFSVCGKEQLAETGQKELQSDTLCHTHWLGLLWWNRLSCSQPGPGELLQKALPVQALLQAHHLPDAVQHCLPRKVLPQVRFKPSQTWLVLCDYPVFPGLAC